MPVETSPPQQPTTVLADGIYIGLPMEKYIADRSALSGGAFFDLLTEAGQITWKKPGVNPLKEEDADTVGQLRGSACHSAILEGPEAFDAAFCVAPEGVLKTGDDMTAWLKKAKDARADLAGLTVSGKVGELRKRVEEARKVIVETDPLYPLFYDEKVGGRSVLSAADNAYVQLVACFVRSNPTLAPYLNDGVPEVTIVITIDGIRYKCRVDYMSPTCDLDLKSYGRPPNIDTPLKRHLIRQAFYNGAHLQAVHNSSMTAKAGALYRAGELKIHGAFDGTVEGDMEKHVEDAFRLRTIFEQRATKPAIFRWLFARMDGPPATMLVPFRQSDGIYQETLQSIERAVEIYREYCERCGGPDKLWFTDHGEQEIEDMDWPMGAHGVL